MKWYLHSHLKIHQQDIKEAKDDISRFYPYVIQVANSFPRDGIAIGALNLQDLIQAGYVGLIQGYNKVDWDRINESPNPEGELWAFLKKRIKWSIRREIDNYGAFIKVPRRNLENHRKELSAVDKVLVNMFPKFFDEELKFDDNNMESWSNEKLGLLLDDLLFSYVRDPKHRQIVRYLFGLDCERLSMKEVADKYNTTPNYINQIKRRSLEKLRNKEVEKIIENFYEN